MSNKPVEVISGLLLAAFILGAIACCVWFMGGR